MFFNLRSERDNIKTYLLLLRFTQFLLPVLGGRETVSLNKDTHSNASKRQDGFIMRAMQVTFSIKYELFRVFTM